MKSLKILGFCLAMIFVVGLTALAQETAPEAAAAVELDENVQASDLGIAEPSILPDSSFYFLKNWGRGIQSFFTFNSVAKAELKEKFANEKLMELRKTIEQNKAQEAIEKAAENYRQEVEEIKNQVEKIKEKAAENSQVESFLDKFIHQQTLHQKLLQKLEEQVSTEASAKIKETREAHLERFGDVMVKLEDRQDKITEKLDKTLEEQTGSQFKEFKNLEVLKNLEESVPDQAKEAIQKAQQNSLKRLQGGMEIMSSREQEIFKEYIETTSGAKEKHLEILEDVKAGIKRAIPPAAGGVSATTGTIQLQERLEEVKSDILERIGAEKRASGECPAWSVVPEFCKEGRVIMEKDSAGCSFPRCIIPGEIFCETFITCEVGYESYDTGKKNEQGCPIKKCIKFGAGVTPPADVPEIPIGLVCAQLWNPVCGKNGKTYSNECFAKASGAEIAHKGTCQEPLTGVVPMPDPGGVCMQVITPAISSVGICKEFSTPCDVPAGWKKVDRCPVAIHPSITVISPNGGERWIESNTYDITWDFQRIESINKSINIGLYTCTGELFGGVASGVNALLGRYSWKVPSPGGFLSAKVSIFDVDNENIIDESDECFTVLPKEICDQRCKDYFKFQSGVCRSTCDKNEIRIGEVADCYNGKTCCCIKAE